MRQAVYNNELIHAGHVRYFGEAHQQVVYFLFSYPEKPGIQCQSITESGNRKYYWNVKGSKAKVTVTVNDERLYYELLGTTNSEEIEEVM